MISTSNMPVNVDRDRLISGANKVLLEGLGRRYNKAETYGAIRLEQIAQGLPTFSDATLRAIICTRSDSEFQLHCEVIESAISGTDFSDEAFVSDYLHLSHCFTASDETKRLVEAVLAFESFEYYEGLTPQGSDFSCPQQRVAQCTAIIAIVNHLRAASDDEVIDDDVVDMETFRGNRHGGFNYIVGEFSDETLFVISDKRLRALITESGTDLGGITAVVTERNLTNVKDILGIIEVQKASPAPAIIAGVL